MFRELTINIGIHNGIWCSLLILINNEFDINSNVHHFNNVVKNLKVLNYKLAVNFSKNNTSTPIHGLLGVDLI